MIIIYPSEENTILRCDCFKTEVCQWMKGVSQMPIHTEEDSFEILKTLCNCLCFFLGGEVVFLFFSFFANEQAMSYVLYH